MSTNIELSFSHLGRITPQQLTGAEAFHQSAASLDFNVLDFWRWSSSDLLSNALRGVLAEFIIAKAICINTACVRTEWDACDLRTQDGRRIEVKSAAYLQSWDQKKLSTIQFDIAPKYGWDAQTNQTSTDLCRHADVYVFCLLAHQDKATVDPLNLDQWTFYVLPASILNERCGKQKKISLGALVKCGPKAIRLSDVANELGSSGCAR